MRKFIRSIAAIFFASFFVSHFDESAIATERDRAIDMLCKCVANLRAMDRLQYEVKTLRTYQVSPSSSIGLPSQQIEVAVKRDGDNIKVSGVEKQYRNGQFIRDKQVQQLSTPRFYARGISNDDASESGMVTTEQIERLLRPLLCSGRFGFELEGYLTEVVRFPELMLIEPDKIRYVGEKKFNGIFCQHFEADTKYGVFSVYIDTKSNYTIRKAEATIGQNSLLLTGNKWLYDMPQIETLTDVVDILEYDLIEGIYVPVKGVRQTTRKDKDGTLYSARSDLERTNIILNPEFDKNTFSADFLKGEVVSNLDDNESGVVYIWDGEKPVPAYTILEGTAFMQGYAGYIRLFLMLAGILMIAYALYRMLIKNKRIGQ